MDKVEKVARAIWEVWRTSDIAPSMYHDFPWEDLKELGEKYPAPQAPGRMLKLAMAEAQAALAAMGEREPVAEDRLALVREDVIRMRLEALFAEKPIEQWGPMSLATALSPNVEALVAAAVSNERLRHASPRPEEVGEAVKAEMAQPTNEKGAG